MSVISDVAAGANPWWRQPLERNFRGIRRRSLHESLLRTVQSVGDRRATVLVGPRQVGKTTLLRQLAEDLLDAGWPPAGVTYFDFSDDRLTTTVTARDVLDAGPPGLQADRPRIFLLDEIGRFEGWAIWLKQAIDEGTSRFVVTDSVASLLHDGSRESGQGRWDLEVMETLSFREYLTLRGFEPGLPVLSEAPDPFASYLQTGGFPEFLLDQRGPRVRERIRADIADRAILKDLLRYDVDVERVKRLFVYLVQASGAIFDAVARARDLGADPRTVRDWVRLLQDTLLVHELRPFQKGAASTLRGKSRFYASDPVLIAAFANAPDPVADPGVVGQMFEAAVYRELREVCREIGAETSYYRFRDDLEIDFVISSDRGSVAYEVTSAQTVREDKIRALLRARERSGVGSATLVYGGGLSQIVEGVQVVPLAQFLLAERSRIASGALLP